MVTATIGGQVDWDTWRHAKEAHLWEAVILSMNWEPGPDRLGLRDGNWTLDNPVYWWAIKFRKLLLKAQRGFVEKSNVQLQSPFPSDDAWRPINLVQFGTWASETGWTLPDEFPRKTENSITHLVGGDTKRKPKLVKF